MTLALQTQSRAPSPTEVLLHLMERVEQWSDPAVVAGAVAEVVREQLSHPVVTVYRVDAAAGCLRLLAAAPATGHEVPGTRVALDAGPLAEAVRRGEVQLALNAYVDPDFVRSLPGETRSLLAVPVIRGGSVLGAVQLEYAAPHRPGSSVGELVEALVQPLSVALAIEAERFAAAPADDTRQGRQARVMAAVAAETARGEDSALALRRVAEGALELVAGESAVVMLRHPERRMLCVAATAGTSTFGAGELIPIDGSVAGDVATTARPRLARTLGAPERPDDDGGTHGVHDVLAVPMSAGGRVYGVLAVQGGGEAGFTAEAVESLQALADQGSAVEAARQLGPLKQQISDASLIAEVGRAMTGTLGLEEVLALVVQAAQMLLNAQCAAVGMVSETGEDITLTATSGVLRRHQGLAMPLRESLMGWVVRSGEVVITEAISDDPRSYPQPVRQGPGVVVPLETRGQIRGALLAARDEGAPQPSDEDVEALRKLGAYAAIAIDNARLYQEQRELTTALRAQTVELERAYTELRTSQQRLVVSEKMAALGRVTAGIAHEINSPLGSILTCLQLGQSYAHEYHASAGDKEVSAADHRAIAQDLIESLELAEGAARRVAQFVRTIKNQTRIQDDDVRQFDPRAEIENTIVLLQHELRNRSASVHTDVQSDVRLAGDPGKFAVIVQNLISNAIDAYEGAPGEVWVRLRAEEDTVVLEVEDRGSGIPEEIQPRIYDYLFTTKDVGRGTGLGLSMVHSTLATHFNGEIDFRSEVGVGTTFYITFPASGTTE